MKAQEQFQLTNFVYSMHAINPAFSGIEDAVNINMGFRRQWASVAEAPLTYYVGFNGSFSGIKNAKPERKTLRKSLPRYYDKLKNETGSIYHGFGMYISGNSFGPFQENSAYLTYSLMYKLNKDYMLSFGLSAEYNNQRFVADKVALYNPDLDQVFQKYATDPSNVSRLNLNIGAVLYGKNMFVGYSVHQLASLRLSADNFTEAGHPGLFHFFTAGYNIPINQQLILQPSTFLKYNSVDAWEIDVLAKLKYRDLIWGGVSYRIENAVGMLFGFRIEKSLYLNYSYDYPLGDIAAYAKGTHELALGYRLFADRSSTPFLW